MKQKASGSKLQTLFKDILPKFGNLSNNHSSFDIDEQIEGEICYSKKGYSFNDGHHSVPIEFTKEAIFWFKLDHPMVKMNSLKGKTAVLKEYKPIVCLSEGGVVLKLHIASFTVLAPGSSSLKHGDKCKDLIADESMKSFLKLAQNDAAKVTLADKKDLDTLPPLESMLTSSKGHKCKGLVLAAKKADKGDVVPFDKMEKLEKNIEKEVAVLLAEDKATKKQIPMDSEGDFETRKDLAKKADALKDPDLVAFLQKKGWLLKKVGSTVHKKSSSKKLPAELKEILSTMMLKGLKEGSPEKAMYKKVVKKKKELAKKRSSAEGKQKKPKALKKKK